MKKKGFVLVMGILGLMISYSGEVQSVQRTYTTDTDFDEGVLMGVQHQTVHNQLQLTAEQLSFPYIWVPNNDNTISKIHAGTGRELGRYRICREGVDASPSRTTVDIQGSCWVGNRAVGTAVKVGLLENGGYIDRNHNNRIDTSRDLNNDGDITGTEILPWGQDECVLWEVVLIRGQEATYVPGNYTGAYSGTPIPRALTIDSTNNVWVGCYNSMRYYNINGNTGQIIRQVDVSTQGHTPYGATIDRFGNLWSSPGPSVKHVLRLTPSTNQIFTIPLPHLPYGIGLDYADHLFVSGYSDKKLSRIHIRTNRVEWTQSKPEMVDSRGVGCTRDNNVWVANSGANTVTRYNNAGTLTATITGFNQPTGIAIGTASSGDVFVCNLGNDNVYRIATSTNTVMWTKSVIGSGGHYSYSDMTGMVARSITTRTGNWTVVYNSRTVNMPWGTISWTNQIPPGATITVRVRSSNDGVNWSSEWEQAGNRIPLRTTPDGQYLQIEATLAVPGYYPISPILYDLTVESAPPAPPLSVSGYVYEEKDIVLDETFEDNEVGKFPSDWQGTGDYAKCFKVTQENTNKVLYLNNSIKTTAYAYKKFSQSQTEKFTAEFDIKYVSGAYLNVYFHQLNTTWYTGPNIYFNGGKIWYFDKSYHEIQPYIANNWYHIKFVCDVKTETYDIWVDNVVKISGAKFRDDNNVIKSIDEVALFLPPWCNATGYVDNIKVGTLIPLKDIGVALLPDSRTTTTDSNGYYEFTNLIKGQNYTVQPQGTYIFTPTQRVYTPLTSSMTNQNFVATSIFASISGYVSCEKKIEEVILDETFEDNEVGKFPSDWQGTNYYTKCFWVTQENTNKILCVDNSSTKTTASAYKKFSSPQTQTFTAEFDIKYVKGDYLNVYFHQINTTYTGPNIYFYRGNMIYYDATWHTIQSYVANRWYHIKFVCDVKTNTYDIWVDNVKKIPGAKFAGYGSVKSINEAIVFLLPHVNAAGYLDNIKVYKETVATFPLRGIKVTLSPGSETLTDANGYYQFTNLIRGQNYTATPQGTYTFTPTQRAYNPLTSPMTYQNFVAVLGRGRFLSNDLQDEKIEEPLSPEEQRPDSSILLQSYPNPAGDSCYIPFKLSEDSEVTVEIYNILGQRVRTIDVGTRKAGSYTKQDRAIFWDRKNDSGQKVSSGLYFVKFSAGAFSAKKSLVIK